MSENITILVLRLRKWLWLHKAHAQVAFRFWQAVRKSKHAGFNESIAAGAHLMLARSLKNKPDGMVIPTYDPFQSAVLLELVNMPLPTPPGEG